MFVYENINEIKEFDELSELERNEYLDKFQEDLEKQENDNIDDLGGANDPKLVKKIADDVSEVAKEDVVKTISDTVSEFEQKFDAKTIIDESGNKITEYKNKLGDVDTDNTITYSDYVCDSYVITTGDYKGMTRPERLDTAYSDFIENSENIIGEPVDDMKTHHEQEKPCSCAVACSEFVIESLMDIDVDEAELREVAKDYGYTDSHGTPFCNIGEIAEHYGLQSEFHCSLTGDSLTLDDAMERIENGEKIIAGVDTSMLYYPEVTESPFLPFLMPSPNHAVEIIGFDKSNPDDIKVIINDPGFEDGAGNVYSWDDFKNCSSDNFISVHK